MPRRPAKSSIFSGELDENVYRELAQTAADQQLTPDAFEAMLQSGQFEELLAKAFQNVIPTQAKELLATLNERAPAMLRERRAELRSFEKRLHRSWRKPLDRLEQLLVIAAETGELFSAQWPWSESQDADLVFDVIRRLHARACQVAGEVLSLLKAGYASGAHARWRAMHETAVTAAFIAKHGKNTAERYLLHEHVEAHDAIRLYQEHAKALKLRRYPASELSTKAATCETLRKQFGDAFLSGYGWAAEALGRRDGRFGFKQIEKDVGLDHWRPYYKMASHPVHANPKSITFSLALRRTRKVLLTGPSNLGLVDPGHSAAIALYQVTVTMLMLRPGIEAQLVSHLLGELVDEIGDAFVAAQQALLKRARAQHSRRVRPTTTSAASGEPPSKAD